MDAPRRDGGFSLVELMVVVLVIALLIAIALPTFLGARTRAQDRATQQLLTNAARTQQALAASTGQGFEPDPLALRAEEPAIDWSGATPDALHVRVGDVDPGDRRQVLLYTRSGSGTWFGIHLVEVGVNAGQWRCRGPAEADVDDFVDCNGADW